jgi:hypothetical protein
MCVWRDKCVHTWKLPPEDRQASACLQGVDQESEFLPRACAHTHAAFQIQAPHPAPPATHPTTHPAPLPPRNKLTPHKSGDGGTWGAGRGAGRGRGRQHPAQRRAQPLELPQRACALTQGRGLPDTGLHLTQHPQQRVQRPMEQARPTPHDPDDAPSDDAQ